MIVSFQPGGNEEHYAKDCKKQFESGDFSLPTSNEYMTNDYPMSIKVRNVFNFEGGLKILKKSVVFPLIFFRASDVKLWQSNMNPKREEMEDYCFGRFNEIIEKIHPKRILIIGIGTYDLIKRNKLISISEERIRLYRNNSKTRLALSAKSNFFDVLAVLHLTGGRPSKKEILQLNNFLKQEFSN